MSIMRQVGSTLSAALTAITTDHCSGAFSNEALSMVFHSFFGRFDTARYPSCIQRLSIKHQYTRSHRGYGLWICFSLRTHTLSFSNSVFIFGMRRAGRRGSPVTT